MQSAVRIEVGGTRGARTAGPPESLRKRLERRSLISRAAAEERLLRAEHRRHEIRKRNQKTSKESADVSITAADRALKLQKRQHLAACSRAIQIEKRRNAATRFLSRREEALARAEMRRAQQLQRLEEKEQQQETVECRRYFLQELERERLRQEHNWVQSRLVMHRVNNLSREGQRRLLEDRLALADRARSLYLGLRAARAGMEVARSRSMAQAARLRAQEQAEATMAKLEERMEAAEQRRRTQLQARSPRHSMA